VEIIMKIKVIGKWRDRKISLKEWRMYLEISTKNAMREDLIINNADKKNRLVSEKVSGNVMDVIKVTIHLENNVFHARRRSLKI